MIFFMIRNSSSNINKSRRLIIAALLVLFVFLFLKKDFLSGSAFFRAIAKFNLSLAKPVFLLKNKVIIFQEDAVVYFRTKKELSSENKILKEENSRLGVKALKVALLEEENKKLLEMFGRRPENNFLIASVLFRPPMSDFDTLIIDAGLKQGVQKGMKITAFGEILLGEADEVFENTSKVKLFSHYGTQINIFFEKAGIAAIASAKGGENFEVLLAKDAQVEEGDKIFTTDFQPFILGKVLKIIKNESEPFQKIYFRYPFNLNELRYVYVLK